MCSAEWQVRQHINYQAYLHTEILLFWTLMKPKVNQTLPKIAIKKISCNSFLLYIWAGSNLISKQVGENIMILLQLREILTKAMHILLCSYDNTSHHKLCSSNNEEDCWNPLIFVSKDLQLTTFSSSPLCVWGTHNIHAHKIHKQLWTV